MVHCSPSSTPFLNVGLYSRTGNLVCTLIISKEAKKIPVISKQFKKRPRQQHGQIPLWQLFTLAVVLSIVWLLWSGLYKPLLISLGALSVVVTMIFAVRMKFFDHAEGLGSMALRLPGYWLWLLKEILVSSVQVTRIVLSPKLDIQPRTVKILSEPGSELPQVILGNSITLSPGTITIDIDEKEVLVHCISEAGARDMESGDLLRRIDRLKGS
jgi:multicomponent Na+:H+ antiporter subunit E